MPELPIVPGGRHGVVTRAEALAVGWTVSALKHAVRTGTLVRLDRGVYAPRTPGDDPDAVRSRFVRASVAAVLVCGPAVASHKSSAALGGLPLWTTPERACATVPPRFTGDAGRAHLHRATLGVADVLPGDIVRTRSARTVLDIARECGVEEAAVVGDAALHREMTDVDRLAATLVGCQNWPGFRRAAAVVPLLDGRAESPLETISRLRLVAAGLPVPDLQTEILDVHGRSLGYTDLYWDDYGVIGEVDGKVKLRERPDDAAWRWLRRQQRLSETGLEIVRWGRADLDNMPALVRRIDDLFAVGARKPASERRWIAVPTPRFAPRRAVG